MTDSVAGKVLIAEDEPVLLRTYARLLREEGHRVETASSGEAAVEQFRTGRFDAVVSDIGLPGMNGLQLFDNLRKQDREIPVMFLTGQPTMETAAKAMELGAFRYLEKPVPVGMFVDAVDSAVTQGRMARLRRDLVVSRSAGAMTEDQTELRTRFNRAIEKLWVAYQPIVNWSTRQTFAHEALLRCHEPSLGNPGTFISAAQKLGEAQTLARAIRTTAVGPASLSDSLLFLNLATADLQDDDLYAPHSPLASIAHRTVLEITEGVRLAEMPDLNDRLDRLRAMGFRIALDDLGSAYSGLNYLASIKPDVVKLDMALVRNIHQCSTRQKMVGALAGLCRDLGMLVVAEGVESPEELRTLVAAGCDHFQGFLFAKPAPPFPAVDWTRASQLENRS